MHVKTAAYRSYVLAVTGGQFPSGLFYDTADPYHYIRTHRQGDTSYLIVGGADHKTGQERDTSQCFAELQDFVAQRFPGCQVTHHWSGQIIVPADGLPFIGTAAGHHHVRVASGFSGQGMTLGTAAAMTMAQQILEEKCEWGELYRADRLKPLAQLGHFATESSDFPAHLISDRLTRGADLQDIASGEGALVKSKGGVLAVYRDDKGVCKAVSAVCTHMGCFVKWNTTEKTWDCPCHGSRFGTDGEVLNGPATQRLESKSLDVASNG